MILSIFKRSLTFPIFNFPGPLFDIALSGNPEDGGVKGNVFHHLGNTETRWKEVTKHPVVLAQCWQVRLNILISISFCNICHCSGENELICLKRYTIVCFESMVLDRVCLAVEEF